jgi:hypothetical protein
MTLFALHQLWDVLQQERRGLYEEQQRLMEGGSLLKKQTASEKEKVAEKWERLNKMEVMLNQEEVAIGLLDAQGQTLMEKAKDLYVNVEAHADATIKQQEDLNGHTITVGQREWMVAEWEQEVREKEEEVTGTLERECSELSSHEANLNTHETTLEVDRKSLGDLRAEVLARKLTAELKENHLAL